MFSVVLATKNAQKEQFQMMTICSVLAASLVDVLTAKKKIKKSVLSVMRVFFCIWINVLVNAQKATEPLLMVKNASQRMRIQFSGSLLVFLHCLLFVLLLVESIVLKMFQDNIELY